MNEKKLFSTFLHDGDVFNETINHLLLSLEKDPGGRELLDHAFRSVHSIKSEAAYLEQKEITGIAHEMETILEKARTSAGGLKSEEFEKLFFCVDRIKEVHGVLKEMHGTEASAVPESLSEDVHETSELLVLDDFELGILGEAKERGESLYRLVCELDSDTPFKYAKAYLLLNNLELLVNVVKTYPSFEREEEDEIFSRIVFLLTTSLGEDFLYQAVNVDQVKSIRFAKLNIDTFLRERTPESLSYKKTKVFPDITIRLAGDKLDSLTAYVDEFKIRLYRFRRSLPVDHRKEMEPHFSGLSELFSGLELLVREIGMVTLQDGFRHFHRLVRDLSKQLNKEAMLVLEGCDIKVDRRAGQILSDIIIHLIRNAMDHGIESPQEREDSGKHQTGTITIRAEKLKDRLVIHLSDDGRGIPKKRIREIALRKGYPVKVEDTNQELLTLVSYPGVTTKDEATDLSGRGYGLDLVTQKIRQFEGGEIKLHSGDGKGCLFTLSIPGGFTLISLQIIRSGQRIIAVPAVNIEAVLPVDKEHYRTDRSGTLFYQDLPVYTLDGRIYKTDNFPDSKQGLVLKYLDHRGMLLTDEMLFTKELPEDQLTLIIDDNPHLYKVSLGDGRYADFVYLNPAIVG